MFLFHVQSDLGPHACPDLFKSLQTLAHAINRDFFSFKTFRLKKLDIFLIFAQNIEAVLTSTHNLCFGAKIRKIGITLHTPVLLYKNGVQGGIHYTDMFS